MSTKTNSKTVVTASSLKPGDKFRHNRLVSTVTSTARNGVWFTTSKGKDRIAPKTEVTLIERAKGVSKTATKKAAAPAKKASPAKKAATPKATASKGAAKTTAKPAAKKVATTPKTTAKKTTAAPKKTVAKKTTTSPAKKAAAKAPAKKAPAKPNTPRKAPVTKAPAPVSKPKRGRRPVKGTKPNLPANATRSLATAPNDIEWEYRDNGSVIVWPVWDDKTLTNKYGTGYPVKNEEQAETLSAAMESGEFFSAVYVMEKPKGVFSVKCIGGEQSLRSLVF